MRRNVSGIAVERTRVHSEANVPRVCLRLIAAFLVAALLALASVPASAGPAPAGRPSPQATSSSSKSSTAKKKTSKKHKRSSRMSGQKAPTPDRITEIQSALARGGYYQGDPNGKWDSNTVAAMQKFQSSNGLEANGKLDALSLQKLGLGSDIAGVSAPKPPVAPSGSASLTPPAPLSAAPPKAPSAGSSSQSPTSPSVRQSLGAGGSSPQSSSATAPNQSRRSGGGSSTGSSAPVSVASSR